MINDNTVERSNGSSDRKKKQKGSELIFKEGSARIPPVDILLVEDNPGDVILIKELLKSSGINFTLTSVSTLKETFRVTRNKDFDAILLDLGLPDSIGLETLNKTREIGRKSAIIVLTGLDDEGIALTALREGAQDYLVKNSLTSNNILRAIKYSLERKNIFDLLEKHNKQFSLLSSSTAAINECEDIKSVYKVTASGISRLIEKAETIIAQFEEPSSLHITGLEWLKSRPSEVRRTMGLESDIPVLHIPRDIKNKLKMLAEGKVHEIDERFSEMFRGKIKDEDCRKVLKDIGFEKIYTVAFTRNKKYYGEVLIFSPKSIGIDDVRIIEAISSQASLSIHRRTVEKELILSESRYRKLNKALERKVKDRTLDLESLVHALKESEDMLKDINATKDKFFSIIAHDLKTPFNSIIGFSSLLADHIAHQDYEGIEEYAGIIQDSSWRAMDLLTNLMEWSRTQTGKLLFNPHNTDIIEIIDEVTELINISAKQKSITISKDMPEAAVVFADKSMFSTILRNLLSNAIKFTNPGGRVGIAVKKSDDEIIVSVSDNGIGLSKEEIEKLFRFDHITPARGTQQETGTGLGLILCREFILKHGGRFWAESEQGKGSTFSFCLKLK